MRLVLQPLGVFDVSQKAVGGGWMLGHADVILRYASIEVGASTCHKKNTGRWMVLSVLSESPL